MLPASAFMLYSTLSALISETALALVLYQQGQVEKHKQRPPLYTNIRSPVVVQKNFLPCAFPPCTPCPYRQDKA